MEDPTQKRRRRRPRRRRKTQQDSPRQPGAATRPARQPASSRGDSRNSRDGRDGRDGRGGRGGGNGGGAGRTVPKGQLPPNLVYGLNSVAVALELGQLKTLFYDKGRQSERLQHIHAQAQDDHVEIRPLQRQGWARILSNELHQGIAGMLADQPRAYLEEVVVEAGDTSCVLVLDQVQDPQNLGAVLRTAAATGVDAVVLPKAGGCGLTPAVHKASAGHSLKVSVVEDENLAQAISFLKEHGYWVIGCDSAEGEDATTFEFPEKCVIVMGNEAEGMRRLTRESCDYLVRIPMNSGVDSLNISVATGVILYLAKADLARAAFEENNSEDNGEPAVTDVEPAPPAIDDPVGEAPPPVIDDPAGEE